MLKLPTTPDTSKQIVKDMLAFDCIDSTTRDEFTLKLMQLITKEPLIVNSFKLSPSHLRSYLYSIKDRKPKKTMMHIMMKHYLFNPRVRKIVEFYENNVGNTRKIMHYLNDLKGKDKVPYVWMLFKSLMKKMYDQDEWSDKCLKNIVTNKDTIKHIKELQERSTGLKVYGGETNTNCQFYDHLANEPDFDIDYESIAEAEYRADLGGGLATPYISMLLGAEYVAHDLYDPKERAHDEYINITTPIGMHNHEYRELLAKQPWKEFNVYDKEGYPKDYDKYSIVSFGFLTSTVKTIDPMDKTEHNFVSTTYHGVQQIMDLVALGKEVHCLFYGRPTIKTYDNVVIQLKFKDNRCVSCDTISRMNLKQYTSNILYGNINMGYIVSSEESQEDEDMEDDS